MATITGTSGDDHLTGTAEADTIDGLAGRDTIDGGAGNDVLTGGLGRDVLQGGDGNDRLVFTTAADSTAADPDLIVNARSVYDPSTGLSMASGGDTLDFTALAASAVTLTRTGPGATVITAQTSSGQLVVNVNGDVHGLDILTATLGPSAPTTYQGSAGADVLVGNPNVRSETFFGGDGDDVLQGSGGSDTLTGGAGADTFRAISLPHFNDSGATITDFETGIDKIRLEGSVTITRSNGVSLITATNIIVFGGGRIESYASINWTSLRDVNGNDLLQFGSTVAPVTMIGDSVADRLVGADTQGGLADTIDGRAGDDFITGLGGADQLTGGAGADTFVYQAASDSRTGGQDTITDFTTGADKIDLTAVQARSVGIVRSGTASFLFVDAAAGQMVIGANGEIRVSDLIGYTGAVALVGGPGADTLTGGAGADSLDGAGGNDTLDGGGGADTIRGGAGDDIIIGNIGRDDLEGGPGADRFRLTNVGFGSPPDNAVDRIGDFETGVDVLDVASFNRISIIRSDGLSYVFGQQVFLNPPREMVVDNVALVSLRELNAADLFSGGTPVSAFMVGDVGSDRLIGSSAAGDNLQGRGGDDVIIGRGGGDALLGGVGADVFVYESAADSLTNNGVLLRQDTLSDFETGVDRIDLTALNVAAGNVSLIRSGSFTFLFANAASGSLVVGAERDVNAADLIGLTTGVYMIGSGATDTLVGGTRADLLEGGAGSDVLRGGEGADTLRGGLGADGLTGGAGGDVFAYGAIGDSALNAADTISDFQSGVDKLDLTGLRSAAGTAVRTGLVSQGGATFVFVDVGADGSTDMLIQLAGTSSLASGDILV